MLIGRTVAGVTFIPCHYYLSMFSCVCVRACACVRARIASGSILRSSFNYSSHCYESTGAFLSRKGYASFRIVFFNLLHSTRSPCAIVLASRLVLRLHAARSGLVATSSHNQDHKITTSWILYVQFITSYYMFRSIVWQSSGRKNASTKITLLFAYLFYVVYEGLHKLHSSVRDGLQVHILS
jgi:hypothetical protein